MLRLINVALATERGCVLRYWRQRFRCRWQARRIGPPPAPHTFDERAGPRRLSGRTSRAARRQSALRPARTDRPNSFRKCVRRRSGTMLLENILAKRVAIECYRAMIAYLVRAIRLMRACSRAYMLRKVSTPRHSQACSESRTPQNSRPAIGVKRWVRSSLMVGAL